MRQVSDMVPEIEPLADIMENKSIDKNSQKHIDAQMAIKNKISKLTDKKGFEYVNVLFNLSSLYAGISDYKSSEKLLDEALQIINKEQTSENKTKWGYIIRFSQILNKEFANDTNTDYFSDLEKITQEIRNYLDKHQNDESEEIIELCIALIMGIEQLQASISPETPSFEECKKYYNRGKNLVEKKFGTEQEMSLSFLIIRGNFYMHSTDFDNAEKINNEIIKSSENLYGDVNVYKMWSLQRLGYLNSYKGTEYYMALAISKMLEARIISQNLFDANSELILNIEKSYAEMLIFGAGKNGMQEASKLIEEILEQTKKIYGETSFKYFDALELQNKYLQLTEDVTVQRTNIKKMHEVVKGLVKKNKLASGIALNLVSNYYKNINSFDEAFAVLDDAISVLKGTPNGEIDYAQSLLYKGEIYIQKGMYNEAVNILNESVKILKKCENYYVYAGGLQWLAKAYTAKNDYKNVLSTLEEADKICKRYNFEQTDFFISISIDYGFALLNNNKPDKAKNKFEEAIKISKNMNNQYLLAYSYKSFGDFWKQQYKNELALENYNNAKNIFEKLGIISIMEYANVLNEMAHVYYDLGQFGEAKNMLIYVLNVYDNFSGKTSQNYFNTLLNLLSISQRTGNIMEAYFCMNTISYGMSKLQELSNEDETYKVNIESFVFPAFIDFFVYVQNLAGETFKEYITNMTAEDKKKAKKLYNYDMSDFEDMLFNQVETELLETKQSMKNLNRDSRKISLTIGDYYFHIQLDKDKALKYYRESIDGLDKKTIEYAMGCGRIANLYESMGNYKQAVAYQKQNFDIAKRFISDKDIELSTVLMSLSWLHFKIQEYPQAFQSAKERFDILRHHINSLFNTMNESDRMSLSFRYRMSAFDICRLLPVYPTEDVTQAAYDAALYYKGLLLRSSNRIRESIYNSNDNALKDNYAELVRLKQQQQIMQVAWEAYNKGDMDLYNKIQEIYARINNLDSWLTQNSAEIRNAKKEQEIKWTNVRDKLQNNELAIEFITFWDSVDYKYGALLLKKDFKTPVYVHLFDEKQLADLIEECGKDMNKLYKIKGEQLYDMIWKPIEVHLQNVKTIYYSPVKKLYSISFNALPIPNQNKNETLNELYDFRMLSRTSEIVEPHIFSKSNIKAELYGDVDYGNGRWGYVWTKVNVTSLRDLLKQSNKIETLNVYTDSTATEATFRKNSGNSATWLYLITHGEFEEIKEDKDDKLFSNRFGEVRRDPMNRTMLIMANANEAWGKVDMQPYESDGVLLASEIANLNLEKTDLLVLAACKTGLGEENETEGIFGLQRAFKLAGVKTIVMTLWEVEVGVTREFMNEFYNNLINGLDKHQSFKNAIDYLKNNGYNNPKDWAGFVMLD